MADTRSGSNQEVTPQDNKKPSDSETISPGGVDFSHSDIANVIDDFYGRVQNDDLLKEPFSVIKDWTHHIERLTHFWWIRFGGTPYQYSYYDPVTKHYYAGFDETYLKRWLGLFHETFKSHLTEKQQEFWRLVSERMGQSLSMRNEYMKEEMEGR